MTLYPYQKEAVDLIVNKKRVLLAYEMGLGKTPITITAIERLMETEDVTDSVLVVVLSSLKFQWQQEIEKWAPESSSVVVHGGVAGRKSIYERIEMEQPEYVIVSYETLLRDSKWFLSHRWGGMVLDECTAIKSFRAARSRVVKEVIKHIPVRVALTGTPIVNGKAEEIFSIFQAVNPYILGGWWEFEKEHVARNNKGWVVGYRNVKALHEKITPHIARKRQLDEDVKDFLPDVVMVPPTYVDLTAAQKKLYERIKDDLLDYLDEAEELGVDIDWDGAFYYGESEKPKVNDPEVNAVRGKVMAAYTALKMLCAHPNLLIDSAEYFEQGVGGSAYCWRLHKEGLLSRSKSPKVAQLVEFVKNQLEADPTVKIVVFASLTRLFPYIKEAFEAAKVNMVEYHGGMTDIEKEKNKKAFQNDPEVSVFLSSDAGGYGVDLPQARILVNFDLPWSPGTLLQRNSRIIRASSEHKQVRVDMLLVRGSVETRVWDSIKSKLTVAVGVVDGVLYDSSTELRNKTETLRSFLEGGA